MSRVKLPFNDILLGERFRKEYNNIPELAESIRRYGIIQPLVVDPNKNLIAGGRRYHACKHLGLELVDVVFSDQIDEATRREMELEENLQRQQLTWQEECLGIAETFSVRKRRAALAGDTWNQRMCAEMFGMSLGNINYILAVAGKLRAEQALPPGAPRPYHDYGSCAEAYRLGIVGEQLAAAEKELAKRQQQRANSEAEQAQRAALAELDVKLLTPQELTTTNEPNQAPSSPVELLKQRPLSDLTREEAEQRYYSNPLNAPGSFDSYWLDRQQRRDEAAKTVYLSNRVIHGDCIQFMSDSGNGGRFDHIITDIPYGIDMDMLNQQNPHQGLTDLDKVKQEHDVKENMDLMARFFPAAFACTNDHGFVITYCDIMQWQFMYDLAVAAGFAVQRWPLFWPKTQAMNQCSQYNCTKDFDPIMVCRKPGAVLIQQPNTCFGPRCGNEQARKDTGHPFAKPYEMTEWLANIFSIPGQTILEPFAGRGSIAIKLLGLDRNVVAVEKQEEHFNALLENVKGYYLKQNPSYLFK